MCRLRRRLPCSGTFPPPRSSRSYSLWKEPDAFSTCTSKPLPVSGSDSVTVPLAKSASNRFGHTRLHVTPMRPEAASACTDSRTMPSNEASPLATFREQHVHVGTGRLELPRSQRHHKAFAHGAAHLVGARGAVEGEAFHARHAHLQLLGPATGAAGEAVAITDLEGVAFHHAAHGLRAREARWATSRSARTRRRNRSTTSTLPAAQSISTFLMSSDRNAGDVHDSLRHRAGCLRRGRPASTRCARRSCRRPPGRTGRPSSATASAIFAHDFFVSHAMATSPSARGTPGRSR